MGFCLPGFYVWDFWFAQHEGTYHLFCLTAPRTQEHPDLRHPHAQIRHASSVNLEDWEYHGVALSHSPEPCWDDGSTWTGSVVRRPDGKWMMFYTGCQRSEDRKIQRIGAALSDDLHSWQRLGTDALIEADLRHYEPYDASRWHDQSFRDPWVYQDPGGKGWRMLFTARDHDKNALGAGVIGQAYSDDLMKWTVEPPLVRVGYYGEMEVPQLFQLDGWWYCLFSNSSRHRDPAYLATGRSGMCTGTHYVRAREAHGPFELVEEQFFAGDDVGHLYGGRTILDPQGNLVLLAFLNHRPDGSFVGEITGPMRMWTTPEGYLRVDATKYGVALREP